VSFFVSILRFELEPLCNFGVVFELKIKFWDLFDLVLFSLNRFDCLNFNFVELWENSLSIFNRYGIWHITINIFLRHVINDLLLGLVDLVSISLQVLLFFELELVLLGVDVRNVPIHMLTMLKFLVKALTGSLLELFGASRKVTGVRMILGVSVYMLC
jgi:hypothetical protein